MGIGAAIAGGVSAATSIAGAAMSSSAAKSAAETQAAAANRAADLQNAQFEKVRSDLHPYIEAGAMALPKLEELTGTNPGGNPLTARLTRPFQPTMDELAQTPGYQFALDQGLKATQNSYAAKGLGQSGAAMKGAADYAEGLAGTTYQQQFQNYLGQNSQIYNMIGGLSGSGQNAAAGLGSLSLNNTSATNALSIGAANASAAGQVASGNAWGNALNSIGAVVNSNSGMFGGKKTPAPSNPSNAEGGV